MKTYRHKLQIMQPDGGWWRIVTVEWLACSAQAAILDVLSRLPDGSRAEIVQ